MKTLLAAQGTLVCLETTEDEYVRHYLIRHPPAETKAGDDGEGDSPLATAGEAKARLEWMTKKANAFASLSLSLGPQIIWTSQNIANDPLVCWKNLLAFYERSTPAAVDNLILEWGKLTMLESETIGSFVARIRQLAERLHAVEQTKTDTECKERLFHGLPASYDHVVLLLRHMSTDETVGIRGPPGYIVVRL